MTPRQLPAPCTPELTIMHHDLWDIQGMAVRDLSRLLSPVGAHGNRPSGSVVQDFTTIPLTHRQLSDGEIKRQAHGMSYPRHFCSSNSLNFCCS